VWRLSAATSSAKRGIVAVDSGEREADTDYRLGTSALFVPVIPGQPTYFALFGVVAALRPLPHSV
jgi:hypothetical protein